MQLENTDYQSLRELSNSHWWKLLCDNLEERIKSIEIILLEPDESDIFKNMDETKKLNLISYKKMERAYLKNLQNLPNSLIWTKIK
jgi:hypothetical protein